MIRGSFTNDEMSRALQLNDEMGAKGFSGDVSTCELFVDLVSKGKLDLPCSQW